ncbi:MAG: GNAT family N-acetyltransferase [Candidatus Shapirobacteria bacterium]
MFLTFRPATPEDIVILNKELHLWGPENYHEQRLERQNKGETTWLNGWEGNSPVGHIEIEWSGSRYKQIQKWIKNCPNLDAIGVKEEKRSQGIGTKLIAEAEKLIKERGYGASGLCVSLENKGAIRLYEKLGYKDWGKGDFGISWTKFEKDGKTEEIREECTYLVKRFS